MSKLDNIESITPKASRGDMCRLSDVSGDSLKFDAGTIREERDKDKMLSYRSTASETFVCPKFMTAKHIIEHHVRDKDHFDQPGVPHNYHTRPTESCKTTVLVEEDDDGAWRTKLRPAHRRVVIVYPRFEQTMKEFSCFLSSLGMPHFVVLEKSVEVEKLLEREYALSDIGYVCAILHPSLVEGLNCTYNPSLIRLNTFAKIPGYVTKFIVRDGTGYMAKEALMRSREDMPEELTMCINAQQEMGLNSIKGMFATQTDLALGEVYCKSEVNARDPCYQGFCDRMSKNNKNMFRIQGRIRSIGLSVV